MANQVIQQGDSFICGICGTLYKHPTAADSCYRNCLEKAASSKVEAPTEAPKRKSYRCNYCKNVYYDFDEAKACAAKCKQKEASAPTQTSRTDNPQPTTGPVISAQRLMELKKTSDLTSATFRRKVKAEQQATSAQPSHPSEGIKFVRDEQKGFRCCNCRQKYSTLTEAIRCFDMHKAGTVGQLTKSEEQGENIIYARTGLKYRCLRCRRDYLTRESVINCFESHDRVANDTLNEEATAWVDAVDGDGPLIPAAEDIGVPNETEMAGSLTSQKFDDTEKYTLEGSRYLCSFCQKQHETQAQAMACFDTHTKGSNEMTAYSDLAPSKEAGSPVPPPAASGKTPKDIESALNAVAAQIQASGGSATDKDKFRRDGAKYICKKCGAKYFTREEVIGCYDGHK